MTWTMTVDSVGVCAQTIAQTVWLIPQARGRFRFVKSRRTRKHHRQRDLLGYQSGGYCLAVSRSGTAAPSPRRDSSFTFLSLLYTLSQLPISPTLATMLPAMRRKPSMQRLHSPRARASIRRMAAG